MCASRVNPTCVDGVIGVPVLYLCGDADDTVGQVAAEGTREFVSGPYWFEILPGIGHFIA